MDWNLGCGIWTELQKGAPRFPTEHSNDVLNPPGPPRRKGFTLCGYRERGTQTGEGAGITHCFS